MSYNLLFDTNFKNNQNKWKYNNCYQKGDYIVSTNKVFGIEQEITLADVTKLYLRCTYNVLVSSVYKVYIGIQSNDKLYVNKKWTKINCNQTISVVDIAKLEKIKVHIIFEARQDENIVLVKEPILADLVRLHKTTWLKFLLDKTIKYRNGFNYDNLLDYGELKPEIFNLEPAKIGSIVCTKERIKLKIDAKLLKGKRYLIKLDYFPINKLGKVYLSYGIMKSTDFNDEQCYLLFRVTGDRELSLNIEPDDVLPYQLNLKHLLLIDIDNQGVETQDIPYLPFIGN